MTHQTLRWRYVWGQRAPLLAGCHATWALHAATRTRTYQFLPWNPFPAGNLGRFVHTLSSGVDAVFDARDPLPFLALHYLQIPVLLAGNLARGNPWSKVDLCIGKIAELYGD
jgi:hypothetical protein